MIVTILVGLVAGVLGVWAVKVAQHLRQDHQNLHALVAMVNQQVAQAQAKQTSEAASTPQPEVVDKKKTRDK